MIIGEGLLATAFEKYSRNYSDVIIFASGVSNSSENRAEEFSRERLKLLNYINYGRKLVYFSTCSVYDPDLSNSPYVNHKKDMESLVCNADSYIICRLPQVVGRTSNRNTLANFIHNSIKSSSEFKIWKLARRNLIDVDDVAAIVNYFITESFESNMIENIAVPYSISMLDLVHIFEKVLRSSAIYTALDVGGSYTIEANRAIEAASKLGIKFDAHYVENIIRKYYD